MADSFRLDWDGDKIKAALRGASMDGIEEAAEHLLQVSTQLAPLEEGDLARSGEVDVDRDQLAASVSYDRVYAARQHEELTWRHDAGKQAKYLEQPMYDEQDTMLALLAASLKRRLGG